MRESMHVEKIQRQAGQSIRYLTPDRLTSMLDAFQTGKLGEAARVWDVIERRDDLLKGLVSKRKKAVARMQWSIEAEDESAEAREQEAALESFYKNLKVTDAYDRNMRGGVRLLIEQMMDSVGKKYSINEMTFLPKSMGNKQGLAGTLCFVPLWHFENIRGELHFAPSLYSDKKMRLKSGEWMVTMGEGLMEASSIAYIFKHLPLRNWLLYCERNGIPAIKAITDAVPDSIEWNSAREAIRGFGSEYNTLLTRGTDIQTIDLTTKGELPYPRLVERMDRALTALWRGSDLSTLSGKDSTGASVQEKETLLLEQDDAERITETLRQQLDSTILDYLFPNQPHKAQFKLGLTPP